MKHTSTSNYNTSKINDDNNNVINGVTIETSIEELKLTPALEDYIETIYNLIKTDGKSRVSDIAKLKNVKNSSVSATLKKLNLYGIINYTPYGSVSFTAEGAVIAQKIASRHNLLNTFFKDILLIDGQLANDTACEMEHILAPEVYHKIVKFVEFIDSNKCPDFINQFNEFSKNK